MIISRSLLRMRNVTDKGCTENQNTPFIFKKPLKENRAVYEIMWKNMVQTQRTQTQSMRFAYRITKARIQTDTQNTY